MCQINTLLHEYPKKHGLSIEWIADTIGVPCGSLQRYLNPCDPLPFPLKLLLPFMRACNHDYSVLDLMESRIGRTADQVSEEGGKKITVKEVAQFASKAGVSISTLAEAIEDQHIDEKENKVCTRALLKLQRNLTQLLGWLNR